MENLFFNPPELRVLHALTQLEGRQRNDTLGVTYSQYRTVEKANTWLEGVMRDLHACYTSGHPAFNEFGQQAYDNLFLLWSELTGEAMEYYPYPDTVSWHQTTDNQYPIGNFVASFYPHSPRHINVVSENPADGVLFTENIIREFTDDVNTPKDVDIFSVIPPSNHLHHAQVFFGNSYTWSVVIARTNEILGRYACIRQSLPTVQDMATVVVARGIPPKPLVVVDLCDSANPINDSTWVVNYLGLSAHTTIVLLTSEHIPFNGQVFVV